MRIVNEDHNGNVNMLMIGGNEQYDGKIKVVSACQSDRILELFVKPEMLVRPVVDMGNQKCISDMMEEDFYYPEKFYMNDSVMKFYRHNSLTIHEAYVKLFNGYQGG